MDYNNFFMEVVDIMKEIFSQNHQNKTDEELLPKSKALRKLIDDFPLPKIIAQVETLTDKDLKLFYLVVYNLHSDSKEILDSGKIQYSIDMLNSLLKNNLSDQITIEYLSNTAQRFFYVDKGYHVGLYDYDIYERKHKFAFDLYGDMSFSYYILYMDEFDDIIDFNSLYSLKQDEVLSTNDFFKIDNRSAGTAILINGNLAEANLENFQRAISHIKLIPDVPKDVHEIFDIAKKLFVLRCFEYHLGMVSIHYASLAVESAMKNFYNETLGDTAVLTNKKNETKIIKNPTIQRIDRFIKQSKGWNKYKLKVNGESYPYSMKKLAEWIINKKKIPKYHIYELDHLILQRNILSHPVHLQIFPSQPEHLEQAAYYINLIFHRENDSLN